MMRIALFLLTNIAVMVVVGIIASLLGLGSLYGNVQQNNLMPLLVLCFLYGMAGSIISLFLSKWVAKRSTGTQVIESPSNATEKWLLDTVARQAQQVGIKMPEVGIFYSNEPNAFATGWNKNSSLVAVSSGLLQTMSSNEVEAVLAHEIGHVANGDMVTLALIQGVVNAFVMFFARIIGNIVDRQVFGNDDDSPGIAYFVVSMVLDIVFGILASSIVMAFSRWREYRADAMGARLAGKNNMIAALEALRPASERTEVMPEAMQAFAISSGRSQSFSFAHLFRSHPTLDQRIEALGKLQ